MTHLMIDLETFGKSSRAVIASIADFIAGNSLESECSRSYSGVNIKAPGVFMNFLRDSMRRIAWYSPQNKVW